ncbi:MAG: VWA domain-containing protein [Planctomycetota bacterium]|nr:VWA domain-containing protein [Planctomycetota bacterium]
MNNDTLNPANPFAGLIDSTTSPQDANGTYAARIDRQNPSCFLFLIDQSASMDESFQGARIKAEALADTVNKSIFNIASRCTFADGCRPYFDIGVIGYGGSEAANALAGPLAGQVLRPITEFEQHPLRVEERSQKVSDNAGGIIEQKVKFPVWVEPRMAGGTPMCAAFRRTREILSTWCASHPNSYPPTVIHVTDGQSTDGAPELLARDLCTLGTNDGAVLLFNLHITSAQHPSVMFPDSDAVLGDQYAKLLFGMSSRVPSPLHAAVGERGYAIGTESRFFGFNADPVSLVQFLQIGTLAAQQR